VNQKFPVILPKFNEILEKKVISSEAGPTWLVGSSLTWVDLVLANLLEIFEDTVDPQLLQNYERLLSFKKNVFNLPGIKKYIETRPETSH